MRQCEGNARRPRHAVLLHEALVNPVGPHVGDVWVGGRGRGGEGPPFSLRCHLKKNTLAPLQQSPLESSVQHIALIKKI